MTRLQRVLQPVNWKYAVGELVLIIAGILIALAASGWSTRRSERTDELQYLAEIRAALDADLTDVRGNVRTLDVTQKAAARMAARIRTGAALSDSVRGDMMRFASGINHVQNRGAYESLKTRGLDLISNDSLRFAITQLYEGQYRFTDNIDEVALESWAQWTRVVSAYVDWSTGDVRNYTAMVQDANFATQLNWWIMYLSASLQIERNLESQIVSLRDAIDRELKSR